MVINVESKKLNGAYVNFEDFLFFCNFASDLKVSTNEKRGGLKVVALDRSPLKVFSLRFSKKSVQGPSCKRPKTTQRTLFLSFEINNWFPITV